MSTLISFQPIQLVESALQQDPLFLKAFSCELGVQVPDQDVLCLQELAIWLVPEAGVAGQAVIEMGSGGTKNTCPGGLRPPESGLRVLFTFLFSHVDTAVCRQP